MITEGKNGLRHVYLLQEDMLHYYWAEILEGLKDCPEYYDYYSPEWTYEAVKTGRLLVWSLSDGAVRGIVLTQILIFPRKKVFEILAIYGMGMLQFFNEMEDVFMHIAKTYECDVISARCRPGLKRLLKGFHAETEAIVLSRSVQRIGEH